MSALESEQPFFAKVETREAIVALANEQRLVVYAGAGVTIDRSDADWGGLVSGLLEPFVPDATVRAQLLDQHGAARAASIATQIYFDNHGENARDRMVDVLRVLLYASGSWREGTLARNIAHLLLAWNHRPISITRSAAAACIVTPNYDDYIVAELLAMRNERLRDATLDSAVPRLRVLYPTDLDPLDGGHVRPPPISFWVEGRRYPRRGEIACVHLHGLIPGTYDSTVARQMKLTPRFPVVGEEDYFLTEEASTLTLRGLLERNSLLIVGASMTDAPLLKALLATKDAAIRSNLKRYVLLCTQNWPQTGEPESLKRLTSERLKHLGVIAVFPDYYGQVAQFVQEIAICVSSLGDPQEYCLAKAPSRYGQRLLRWWKEWSALRDGREQERQEDVHGLLRDMLHDVIVPKTGASSAETFKLELWTRWQPSSIRSLRLWASSTGPWIDEQTMREGRIKSGSPYLSVEAFCNGRPTPKFLRDDEDPESRWRTYISTPVSHLDEYGAVPVGVITLASMAPPASSAINPQENRSALRGVLNLMRTTGEACISTAEDAVAIAREGYELG